MKIIDRYLLRQYIQVYVICFLSLTGLYVVLDAFTNLDEFMRYSEKEGNLMRMMAEYYMFRTLAFFERLSGVMSLIAAMFTVTWIQRHNELTALMAAGISRVRVVKPVIVACVAIAAVTAAGRELVIPRFRQQLSRDAKNLSGDQARTFRPVEDARTHIILRGGPTFANERKIEKPNFLMPNEAYQWGTELKAAHAYFKPAAEGRASGYLLSGVTEPRDLANQSSLAINGETVVIAPRDAPWLAADQCFVVSDVTYEQLTGGQQWRQFSSTAQLIQGLRNPSMDYGPDVRVAIHVRVVQPLLDVTLLFLGLPLVLTRESRNMFYSIGLCVGLVALYSSTVLSCQFLGTSYMISPAFSAWFPLMVYVPIAVAMFEQARR